MNTPEETNASIGKEPREDKPYKVVVEVGLTEKNEVALRMSDGPGGQELTAAMSPQTALALAMSLMTQAALHT